MNRKTGGFTLIEMTVGIVCASVVTLAAMTLLLTGVRTGKRANDTASRSQTARTVISMVEKLAGSGDIKVVEELDASGEPGGAGNGSWLLVSGSGDDRRVLLRYNAGEKELLTGGAVLMSGVDGAEAKVSDDNRLLEFSLTSGGVDYKTGVCCRTGMSKENLAAAVEGANPGELKIVSDAQTVIDDTALSNAEKSERYHFLITLCTQAGSEGKILNSGDDRYYSEWYIGGYEGNQGWSKETPWCGCFVSWAVSEKSGELDGYDDGKDTFKFADVDKGMRAFKDPVEPGEWKTSGPVPADLIFFDRDFDGTADHVGVVLCVTEGSVYTVEGNCGGKVRLQSYAPWDFRILGYGALPWKTESPPAPAG